jgi:hypothetical protein
LEEIILAKINPKQEKFIMALMATNTTEEAYKQVGIGQSTAYKYMADPSFKEEYLRMRRETMQQVTSKLQQSALIAVETLNNVMADSENSTASARVQASKIILENAYRGLEMDDLLGKLEQLEKRLDASDFR